MITQRVRKNTVVKLLINDFCVTQLFSSTILPLNIWTTIGGPSRPTCLTITILFPSTTIRELPGWCGNITWEQVRSAGRRSIKPCKWSVTEWWSTMTWRLLYFRRDSSKVPFGIMHSVTEGPTATAKLLSAVPKTLVSSTYSYSWGSLIKTRTWYRSGSHRWHRVHIRNAREHIDNPGGPGHAAEDDWSFGVVCYLWVSIITIQVPPSTIEFSTLALGASCWDAFMRMIFVIACKGYARPIFYFRKPAVGVRWPTLSGSRKQLDYLHIAGPCELRMESSMDYGQKDFWESLGIQENRLTREGHVFGLNCFWMHADTYICKTRPL